MKPDEATRIAEESIEKALEVAEENEKRLPPWLELVAVFSAVVAVLAALTAIVHEFVIEEMNGQRTNEILRWEQFGEEELFQELIDTRNAVLQAVGASVPEADLKKKAAFKESAEQNREAFFESQGALDALHDIVHLLAAAQVFLNLAIAMAAITLVVRKKAFFRFGILLSVLGVSSFVIGTVMFISLERGPRHSFRFADEVLVEVAKERASPR